MSRGREGGLDREISPFFFRSGVAFFLTLSLLVIIYFFFIYSSEKIDLRDSTPIFKNKKIFSHLDLNKREKILYTIKSRENLNRTNIHRVYFYVEMPKEITREHLKAVAQKVVKDTISLESCHSINIDFGPYGYVDFAPYGNWTKAGEVPIGNYKDYRFEYHFSSIPSPE